ncbi:hypothetical protein GCM10010441_55510 [Kitasatospora paracochleata]|uniref:DUF11 domain-containing protein n=1 Tax=Kitasatospora paracochleata TaxID=58354 RepID=A0ABT1J6G8_9ACTN|nr:hypothetical protein [Kitasatospora paracochleata]MCP2313027.1 hypothetical protein [Kitasatospora paracochleata]
MSDKHPADETPTERLLREALNARASLVTAQSLRPAAPPKTRLRRLKPVYAVAVPLFGLAAGVLGYFTVHATPTAMKHDSGPAASVSASPTEGVQIPADPSPSPSASTSPTSIPAIAQDYLPSALTATVDGLAKGTKLTAGGDPVSFTVTWTNTTEVRFDAVVPLISEQWQGGDCRPDGLTRFQSDSGSGWKDAVQPDPDPTPQVRRADGVFALEPGASHTVKYRVQPGAVHGVGTATVVASAYGMVDGHAGQLGTVQTEASVVDDHRPTAALAAGPSEFVAGRTLTELDLAVSNGTGTAMSAVAPAVTVHDESVFPGGGYRLRAARVTAEVKVGDQWRKVATTDDSCRKLVLVDTSSLQQTLAPGASARFTFRFGYTMDNSDMSTSSWVFGLGATAGGHAADTVEARPKMTVAMANWTPPPSPSPSASATTGAAAGGTAGQ